MDNLRNITKPNSRGRNGDPRMNRSVEAKLQNPKLSLHEALIIGGFDYPEPNENDKSSTYSLRDSEGVLLGQRKNQLSRRLREKVMKNQLELNKKEVENGRSKTAVYNTKDITSQCSKDDSSLSENKNHDKELNNVVPSLAVALDFTSHETESTISEKIKTIHHNNELEFKLQIPKQVFDKNPKALLSSKDYASIFSEKLKDCYSFGVPTIPIPTDISSHLNYCTKPNQDSIDRHEYETEFSTKIPMPAKPLFANNELNTKITSNSKSSNATNSNHLVSNSSNILRSNDFKSSDDSAESESVISTFSFKSKDEQKNAMLQKAMDIFSSDIDNYLQGIMVKAGYSRNEITEEDYFAFFASTISLSIERFQSISAGSNASCCLVSSTPIKKRTLENNLNVSYPKLIFDEKQLHEQKLHQYHHHVNVPHVNQKGADVDSYYSSKHALTTIVSDLTYESEIKKYPKCISMKRKVGKLTNVSFPKAISNANRVPPFQNVQYAHQLNANVNIKKHFPSYTRSTNEKECINITDIDVSIDNKKGKYS